MAGGEFTGDPIWDAATGGTGGYNQFFVDAGDEVAVVRSTTSTKPEPIEALFHGADVLKFHEIVRDVPVAEEVARHTGSDGTRPGLAFGLAVYPGDGTDIEALTARARVPRIRMI